MINLTRAIETAISGLTDVYTKSPTDRFFTEKEIHSYFYHLCQNPEFQHAGHSLVHTEYPTPFKCRTLKAHPYIERAEHDSKHQRAHVDLVVINPNYIDHVFATRRSRQYRYLTGIGNELFSKYIVDFYELYREFAAKYGESVLLYAIEFKYQRHSYSGEKYPAMYLAQDISKLRLLTDVQIAPSIPFCKTVRSVVFIGERISEDSKASMQAIAKKNSDVCIVVMRQSAQQAPGTRR